MKYIGTMFKKCFGDIEPFCVKKFPGAIFYKTYVVISFYTL